MTDTTAQTLKDRARTRIEADSKSLLAVSHEIFEEPELAFEEVKSAARLADLLEDGGMKVERAIHGLETAFRGTAGELGPHVVICAEYDALPEIGHACGHNIIGTSSVGAGLALSELADDLGIRVTVLGTPAEEGGGGKVELMNAGAFDDATVSMMVHPAPLEVVDMPCLAIARAEVTYHGMEAHASAFPERGLNALDAVNLSYSAIAALRQHISRSERIHGIITHGGDAPNVVPKMASATYYIRARNLEDLKALKARVIRCFEAGALATGCELELVWAGHDYSDLFTNPTIAEFYDSNLQNLGRSALPRQVMEAYAGSTDMGNVSFAVPSIHPMMGINSLPAVNHQADFARHTISADGDKAVVDAALAMAWTTIDLATTPGAFDKVRAEFEAGPPTETRFS
ncbi:MAG: M20 family metallopeptidase [Actinobacteria bacterium]|nr:M20 family metallopeptidase [Actinomycetota bacterium]